MDDGVCGQVGEPGQGCHKGRGICAGRTTTLNAAALEQAPVVPLLPGKPTQAPVPQLSVGRDRAKVTQLESSIAGTTPGSL